MFLVASSLMHCLRQISVVQVLIYDVLRDAEYELTRLVEGCLLIAVHVRSRCIGWRRRI